MPTNFITSLYNSYLYYTYHTHCVYKSVARYSYLSSLIFSKCLYSWLIVCYYTCSDMCI